MPISRIVSFLKNSLAESSLPTRTEEGRQFFQERLALFGKCCFFLTVAAFVIRNITWIVVGDYSLEYYFTNPKQHNSVFFALAFAGVWALCARVRVPAGLLRILDVALVLAVCVSGTLTVFASTDGAVHPDRMTMLATIVLIFRALILPSTAGWTLAVSLVVIVPTIFAYKLILESDAELTPAGVWEQTIQGAGIWGIIVASVATIASRVIFSLRRDVQEAQQLGQYTLERKLGEGAMGIVYVASHALLRRPTAVKILRPETASDTSIARFEREVQLTSSLTHPNTIAIYDYGRTPDGMFYYAMEYLEGITLQDLVLQYGPVDVPRAVHILRQVGASLVEAHSIGLIHRDIKPANVILCCRGGMSDVVKVVDFGLVKNTDKASIDPEISTENTIAGTPHYMSPEASLAPGDIDGRSDIYSVGATAYFLLTGRPVFEAAGVLEVISDHIKTPPKPPSERLGKSVASDVEALVLRCLAKQRDDRFADTLEFLRELEALAEAHPWPSTEADAWWAAHGGDIRPEPAPVAEESATMSVEIAAGRGR